MIEQVRLYVWHFMGNRALMRWERTLFVLLNREIPFPLLHADQCDIWTEVIPIPSDYSIRAGYCHAGSLRLRQQLPPGEGGQEEKET